MIIKGERLPFSMNIVPDAGIDVRDYPGINWEEELSFSNARGSRRRTAKELRASSRAKRAASRDIKRLERASNAAERKAKRQARLKINAELRAERKLTRERIRVEREAKKAKAAEEKAKELKAKAEALASEKPDSTEAGTAEWQAKVEARKAERQEKKAEKAEKDAEKKENATLADLQKQIDELKAGKDKPELENEEEKEDGNLDTEIGINDEINPNNYEQIPPATFSEDKEDEGGMPWWGWALIGVGGLSLIGTWIYLVSKKK